MKRILALALCLLTLCICLISCGGAKKCDICEEEKTNCTTLEILGEKLTICGDCEKELNALGDMFS